MKAGSIIGRVGIFLLLGTTFVAAQQIWVGGNRGGGRGYPPKWATPADFDGSFVYCRAYYDNGFSGGFRGGFGGGGDSWRTDYPGADNNFSVRLAELTRVRVRFDANRQPNYVVVSLNDPLLYRCPILFMEAVEWLRFDDRELEPLRNYLLKGGFLWVDDFWGSHAWENWATEISRVLSPREFPIVDIPVSHAILHTLYDVKDVPQVPAISFWRSNGGATSERGSDSAEVHFRGILDRRGRVMVLITHNTDIADTWEREGEEPKAYFDLFSPRGYAIGVNVMLYAMSH
ncbi:MAG TPA: DUF4159 domain-containing protein [Vicinamibacterales bacterium]|jgi:hypothetical protein|nr:DUF4159 domain-containing protein [Vicinamibacterales bacterium]